MDGKKVYNYIELLSVLCHLSVSGPIKRVKTTLEDTILNKKPFFHNDPALNFLHPTDMRNLYDLNDEIGHGAFGVVYEG